MNLETALKKPRTVPELVKLTKLSRGGVLSGLKRLKAKKVGKVKNERGPSSLQYQLRSSGAFAKKARKYLAETGGFKTPAQVEQATLDAAPPADCIGTECPYPAVVTPADQLVTDTIAAAIADTEEKRLEVVDRFDESYSTIKSTP